MNFSKYAITFICYLTFWIAAFSLKGDDILEHNKIDHHTLQALAWRSGTIHLPENIQGMELVTLEGKVYVSFPPTPSLIELPLTFFFGRQTPNTLVLILASCASAIIGAWIFFRFGLTWFNASFLSFGFFAGSQMLYLSLEGTVWSQGQVLGVFFTMVTFCLTISENQSWTKILSGFSLGLATGCRPHLILQAPVCLLMIPSTKERLKFIAGLALPLVTLAIYNELRFHSPFEFGHNLLPWSQNLPNGVFSLAYLKRNAWHAFVNLPNWDGARYLLHFDPRGTSIFISAPLILLGLGILFVKKIPVIHRLIYVICFFILWVLLLLHESNGWFQFGYRYSVDLIPLALLMTAKYCNSIIEIKWVRAGLFLLIIYSVLLNIYGVFWFYIVAKNVL